MSSDAGASTGSSPPSYKILRWLDTVVGQTAGRVRVRPYPHRVANLSSSRRPMLGVVAQEVLHLLSDVPLKTGSGSTFSASCSSVL
jgi:hypothetical protein